MGHANNSDGCVMLFLFFHSTASVYVVASVVSTSIIAFPTNKPLMFSALAAIIAATSLSCEKLGARKSVGITRYFGKTESTNSKPFDFFVAVSYPPITSAFVTLDGSTALNLILSFAVSDVIFPPSIRSKRKTPSV